MSQIRMINWKPMFKGEKAPNSNKNSNTDDNKLIIQNIPMIINNAIIFV